MSVRKLFPGTAAKLRYIPGLLQQQESVRYNAFSRQSPMIDVLGLTLRDGYVPTPLTVGAEICCG